MTDIRLIIVGSVISFSGFVLGGIEGAQYMQFTVQASEFDQCFDYSGGYEIKVNCDEKLRDGFFYLAASLGLIGAGIIIIVKGIRGKWDQNVKSDELVGPKK